MANRFYSNTAIPTTLSAAITNVATSVSVVARTGYPTQFPHTIVIDEGTASEELCTVTAAAGTTMTVTRGSDGTTAVAHSISAAVRHVTSARDFTESQDHLSTPDFHMPTGVVLPFAASSAPSGWLLANGAAVSRATYAALFTTIGTTHGSGDGSTTFNVPDLRGRMALGAGAGTGLTSRTLAATAGAENAVNVSHSHSHSHSASSGIESGDHQHTGSTGGQSASHSHTLGISDAGGVGGGGSLIRKGGISGDNSGSASNDHGHAFTTDGINANHTHAVTVNTDTTATGSSATNANMPPYTVLTYIIKT